MASAIERITSDLRARESIAFPPYCLDLRSGRLIRGTEIISLRPKTWAVLRHLAEQPGALVTKDDLLDTVWPATAVTPDTLTKSIGELRHALGDDPKHPRFIETVHRRGFRFIAPVRQPDDAPSVSSEPGDLEPRATASAAPVFVGRSAELHQLAQRFRLAVRGQRQIVFVTGEVGIGKSALVETFLQLDAGQRADDDTVCVARGYTVEQHAAHEAYLPVLDALGRLTHLMDQDVLVSLLRRHAPAWLAQLPGLLDPDSAAALRQSLGVVRPERMLHQLADFLEELCTATTLVLVLEDMHWSDHATVEALAMLAQRREPARLLVIATYRPAEAVACSHPLLPTKQTLQMHQQCHEIALQCLSRTEVASYLDRRFSPARLPTALADLLHEHTDGTPLFVVAAVDQLVTRGWLVETDPGWALSVSLETLRLEVPDDLRQVILSQVHALVPRDQALIEAASIAGVEFTAGEIAGDDTAGEEAIETACERLTRTHRFLRVAGTAAFPDGRQIRRYAFIHGLYQDVVYHAVPEGRRQRLHRRIGAAIENQYGREAAQVAQRLALHFEHGRDPARAIMYLAASATRALDRFAGREAVSYLARALALLDQLPDQDERRQREIELRLPYGWALNLLHGYSSDQARENFARFGALCRRGENLPQRYEALNGLWFCQLIRAERDTTPATAEQLTELARRMGDQDYRLRAALARGVTALWQGRHRAAHGILHRLVATWERQVPRSDLTMYGENPIGASRSNDGLALWFLGYPDRARERHREALRLVTQPAADVAWNTFAAILQVLCRNATESLALAERAVAVSEEHGLSFWLGIATALGGAARILAACPTWQFVATRRGAVPPNQRGPQAEAASGVQEIGDAVKMYHEMQATLALPMMLGWLAEGCLRLGAIDEGMGAVSEALSVEEATFQRMYEPELWRLKGELLSNAECGMRNPESKEARKETQRRKNPQSVIHGPQSEAEACFQRALEIARKHDTKSLELRAAMSLMRLRQREGRTSEGRALLAPLYGWFREGFDTPDLTDAKALLDSGST